MTAQEQQNSKRLNLEKATNFMRQYRDPQSRELKKLSANQFMEVWSHYDKDGKDCTFFIHNCYWTFVTISKEINNQTRNEPHLGAEASHIEIKNSLHSRKSKMNNIVCAFLWTVLFPSFQSLDLSRLSLSGIQFCFLL